MSVVLGQNWPVRAVEVMPASGPLPVAEDNDRLIADALDRLAAALEHPQAPQPAPRFTLPTPEPLDVSALGERLGQIIAHALTPIAANTAAHGQALEAITKRLGTMDRRIMVSGGGGGSAVGPFPLTVSATGAGSAALPLSTIVTSAPPVRALTTATDSITVGNFPTTQPVSIASPVVERTSQETAARLGFSYIASVSASAMASGCYLRLVMKNPTGSGKNLLLWKITVLQSSAATVRFMQVSNPTNAPTTAVTQSSSILGNPVGVATLFTDTTNAATSLTPAPTSFSLVPENGVPRDIILPPRIITPGSSIGYQLLNMSALGGTIDCATSFFFWEE